MKTKIMWWENSDENIKCYNMNLLSLYTIVGGAVPLSMLLKENSKNLKVENTRDIGYCIISFILWGIKIALEITVIWGTLSFSFINLNLLYICISLGLQYKYYLNIKSTYRIYKVSSKKFESPFNKWVKPFVLVSLVELIILCLVRMG